MNTLLIFLVLFFQLFSECSGFLWTLFDTQNCNCCRCFSSTSLPSLQTLPTYASTPVQNSYPTVTAPNYLLVPPAPPPFQLPPQAPYNNNYNNARAQPVYENFQNSQPLVEYSMDSRTEVQPQNVQPVQSDSFGFNSPPAVQPASQEVLQQLEGPNYSTNQIPVDEAVSSVTPIIEDNSLSQLELELAEEKYRYNLEKEKQNARRKNLKMKKRKKGKKNNQREQRIRVFQIYNHRHQEKFANTHWAEDQAAKYEKHVESFAAHSSNEAEGAETPVQFRPEPQPTVLPQEEPPQLIEEFIPIEVGNLPEISKGEPAAPPPSEFFRQGPLRRFIS